MKALFACGACALLLAALTPSVVAQSAGSPAQIKPLFSPTDLIVDFAENFGAPIKKTLEDAYAAAGVTEVAVFPTFAPGDHIALLRLKPGASLGRAFWTLQTFDFGANSRWSVRNVQPNFIAFAAVYPGVPTFQRTFNLSARAEVRAGESATIGGLIVPGEFPRLVVFKVRGASLAQFGVAQALANPKLTLYQGTERIAENDDWGQLREFEKGMARPVCSAPDNDHEAMYVTYLDPGAYTVVVSSADGSTGVALLEMYIVDAFMIGS